MVLPTNVRRSRVNVICTRGHPTPRQFVTKMSSSSLDRPRTLRSENTFGFRQGTRSTFYAIYLPLCGQCTNVFGSITRQNEREKMLYRRQRRRRRSIITLGGRNEHDGGAGGGIKKESIAAARVSGAINLKGVRALGVKKQNKKGDPLP